MWFLRMLLAHLHIRRIASLEYSDGKVRDGEIVNESWRWLCVRAGVYGIYRPIWIQKTEPTLRGAHWSSDARLAGAVAIVVMACLLVSVPFSLIGMPSSHTVVDIDPTTGLPVISHVFYPEQLPDGHYSVAKALPHGESIVVQHLPGPDRDFAFYVMNRFVTNMPHDCASGDRFTIFRGQVV